MKKHSIFEKILFILALSIGIFTSCSTTAKSADGNSEKQYQANGLAVLNIQEPLILEAYPTVIQAMELFTKLHISQKI